MHFSDTIPVGVQFYINFFFRLMHEEFRDLLQTPTIVRKSVSMTRGEHHINLDQTSHTPHSILKV